MSVFKTHYVALDMYKPSGSTFEVVEGDTANLIVITLTDRGQPVNLTDCKVVVAFVRGGMPAEQDTDGNGVTVSGENHNIITIDLYSTSYVNGNNTAEVQVWSGAEYDRLATSGYFTFKARRARVNANTVLSVPTWPLLSSMINTLNNIARGVQAKWSTTNIDDPSYIQDKPVIGTDLQAATQNLTAATELIADTARIAIHDITHKTITWAQIKSWIATALSTTFSSLSHAARHASNGADALSTSDIGAADTAIHNLTTVVSANGALAADQGPVITALITTEKNDLDNKKFSALTLLWTNASPSSSFAAQTISLDLSTYDAIRIEFYSSINLYYGLYGSKDFRVDSALSFDGTVVSYVAGTKVVTLSAPLSANTLRIAPLAGITIAGTLLAVASAVGSTVTLSGTPAITPASGNTATIRGGAESLITAPAYNIFYRPLDVLATGVVFSAGRYFATYGTNSGTAYDNGAIPAHIYGIKHFYVD